MRSTYGGWVLNLGGRYGTPGIADEKNIVRVAGGRRVSKNPELLVMYNPNGGRAAAGAGVEFNVRKHTVRRKAMRRRRRRNLPLTVRSGRRKHTYRALVRRVGVKRAAKMWRKAKKFHGYSKHRVSANKRRRRRSYNSWKGHKAGHRRAAKKGWRKRRRGRARRRSYSRRRKGSRKGACRARKGSIKYGKCYYSRAKLRRKIGKRRFKKLLKRRGR
jgi:hypothetical protein